MPATVHQTQNSFGKAAHSIRVAGTMQTALSSRNVMKLTFSGGSERSVSCFWTVSYTHLTLPTNSRV